jgi:DNA-binding transcriptional regulator YiaG
MNKLPTMTAEEIIQSRATLDKVQREMAELLGVDLRTYQRWEGNERGIPGPAVLLLRRILTDHKSVHKKMAS